MVDTGSNPNVSAGAFHGFFKECSDEGILLSARKALSMEIEQI